MPATPAVMVAVSRFTHVDPFEDTESMLRASFAPDNTCFTHVDPFEDTESRCAECCGCGAAGFTHVDPFEDTER